MNVNTLAERLHGPTARRWGAGVAGGLAGGVAMGVVMHLLGVMPLVGALYGSPTVLGGWLAHLLNSVLFGLVFVAVVTRPFVRDLAETAGGCVLLGVGYGALLEIVSGGIILPFAVNATGAAELPVPLLPLPGLVEPVTLAVAMGAAHLVYGAVLGVVYAVVRVGPVVPDH